jgi:hydrogenase maturation protease
MNLKTVILGVGNWLMSDDGVGVHVAQALALDPPPGVEVVDAGTDVLSALPFLEQADRVLIVDAAQAGGSPGAVRELVEGDLVAPRGRGATTLHAVNLLASRHLMAPGAVWPEVLILGVEPAVLDYGLALSPAVAAALPQVERRCREIVAAWQTQDSNTQPDRSA